MTTNQRLEIKLAKKAFKELSENPANRQRYISGRDEIIKCILSYEESCPFNLVFRESKI